MSDSNLQYKNKIIPIKTQSRVIFKDIIGHDTAMQKIFRIVEKVADSDTTIMLNGETGTGKGLIARAIHKASRRKDQPFIQINCGATPEGLLESEFFGYRRGAFTGATADKPGKFEIAQGGTIFLDEIGDMSADLQVKVLRVLEEGEFERVGGHETIKTDARFIAATHRDLEEEVQKGNFREDLFFRLYVIPIMLPSLKERKADIPYLVSHFIEQFAGKKDASRTKFSEDAMNILTNYSWPGNVRELKNLIERLSISVEDDRIEASHIPSSYLAFGEDRRRVSRTDFLAYSEFKEAKKAFEEFFLLNKLEQNDHNISKTARSVGVGRNYLHKVIKRVSDGEST